MSGLLIFFFINVAVIQADININTWERTIDLTSNIIKIDNEVTVTNIGSNSISNFDLFIPQNESTNLFEMNAKINNEQTNVISFRLDKNIVYFNDFPYAVHSLSFSEEIKPNSQVTIVIRQVFNGLLFPLPEYIQQNKPQLFIFHTDTFIKSMYKIDKQMITFILNINTLKRHSTRYNPVVQSNKIIYDLTKDSNGNINGQQIDSSHKSFVHFQSNANFVVIEKMVRNIEVSSWGFIYVEDYFDLIHTGAKLTGEFSRLSYTTNPDPNSVNSFEIDLPSNAKKIYYKDVIGNISTSSYQKSRNKITLNLIPRFPLLGGWNVQFFIGYYLPSKSYVSCGNNGSIKRLKIPLVDKFSQNFVLRNLDVNVILPEHSKNVKITTKNKKLVNISTDQKHFAYLDTFGRPILKFQANNLIDEHVENFEVLYHLNDFTLWMKPMLLFMYFLGINLVLMFVYKFDFSFKKSKTEFVDKSFEFVDELKKLIDNYKSIVKDMESHLEIFKKHKDSTKFNDQVTNFEKQNQQIIENFKTLQPTISKFAPELTKNLSEIKNLIESRIGLVNKNIEISKKLVSSVLNRKDFLVSYDSIVSKQKIIDDKLPNLLDCLY